MPWMRALLVWLVIIAAESVNGTLRTLYLAPVIGDFPARRVGVFIAIALIFLITLACIRWMGVRTKPHLLGVGAMWVVMTVLFELALGRFVFRYEWSRMLSDYDLSQGGLMVFGLTAMLFTPLLAARIHGRVGARRSTNWWH